MPELPEVEFARQQLSHWLKKSKIAKVSVTDARILDQGVKADAIVKALRGKIVKDVERRGKWLRFVLDQGLV
ncbi:MAG: DNA-formamidopyrimidine glycosylase family protein, partial [Polyangiaceae bacterium]